MPSPVLPSLPDIAALQDQATAAWHRDPCAVLAEPDTFAALVAEQHRANFELWHIEDTARTPGVADAELAATKRTIDRVNQRRNDLSESCDAHLLALLAPHGLPVPAAELHSESPGLMIDRLSILSLKRFHTREELDRQDAPAGHRERNRERLAILEQQRRDLAAALERLWRRILSGERGFRVYRQLKMYNDPSLNPAVYEAQTARPAGRDI